MEDVNDSATFNGRYTSERNVPILCGNSHIYITRNAKEALDALRARYGHDEVIFDTTSYLWLDGICINQEDLLERAAHVKIMGQIYAKADRVFIWLGPALPRTNRAIELVMYLASIDRKSYPLMRGRDPSASYTYEALGMPRITLEDWLVLISFLERSWFSRIWVVQEFSLTRLSTTLCGESAIPRYDLWATSALICETGWYKHFHDFEDQIAVRAARQKYDAIVSEPGDSKDKQRREESTLADLELLALPRPSPLIRFRPPPGTRPFSLEKMSENLWPRSPGRRPDFLAGLVGSKGKTASDNRDKVYALLGLINKALSKHPKAGQIEPSYATENSVAQVYIDLSFRLIIAENKLDILGFNSVDLALRDMDQLPSWSLDLSKTQLPHPLKNSYWNGEEALEKLKFFYRTPSLGANKTLCVQGILIGRESHRASPFEIALSNQGWAVEWLKLARLIEHPYCTGEDPVEVLWRTLITNRTDAWECPAPSTTGRNFVFYLFRLLIGPKTFSEGLGIKELPKERRKTYQEAVEHMAALRRAHPSCELCVQEEHDK